MNVRKNSNYQQQTIDQIREASILAGLSEDQGIELIDNYFHIVRTFLNDERMPSFMLPYMGKITPTLGSIRRSVGLTLKLYKTDKITKDIALYRIKKFWPIRRRLLKEAENKETFKYWIDIPSAWQKEGIKELYEKAYAWYSLGGKTEFDISRGIYKGRTRGSKIDLIF
jgi:hypothetical protein